MMKEGGFALFFVSSKPRFRWKSMKLISSNKIGIQSGTFTMFSDFDKAGEMWVGTGPRERHKRVTFKRKFISPPSSHIEHFIVGRS